MASQLLYWAINTADPPTLRNLHLVAGIGVTTPEHELFDIVEQVVWPPASWAEAVKIFDAHQCIPRECWDA